MNGYVTNLSAIADCPVSVPLTRLPSRHSGLIVTQIKLVAGQRLDVRYLGLHFVKFLTLGGIAKLNTALPTVYVGVYHGNFEKLNEPVGRPVAAVGSDFPGYFSFDTENQISFEMPGIYSFVLVNNASSNDVAALVTGSARTFDPR